MNNKLERERTLKLFASDDEWAAFTEALPRDWRKRFEQLARCAEVDVEKRPERRRGVSYLRFTIPDCRANDPSKYETAHRRGQFLRSWKIGVQQREDGSKSIAFSDGLTWGSIGQILGYLLGDDKDKEYKDSLYDELEEAYRGTDQ
ncbi:MAG: hypothetical protein CUN57_01025, partial [Phototrophicales bacterium]